MWQRLRSTLNRMDFALRDSLQWRRGHYDEPWEDKSDVLNGMGNTPALYAEAVQLIERYTLQTFALQSSAMRYLEVLSTLRMLEPFIPHLQHLQPSVEQPIRWLDVGSKNGAYLLALRQLMTHLWGQAGQTGPLVGIELDAYRLYANGYTRLDLAHAFIAEDPHTRYLAQNVLDHHDTYDVVTCFFTLCICRTMPQVGAAVNTL